MGHLEFLYMDDAIWLQTPNYQRLTSGGPGFEGPRPANNQGWLGRAVQYFTVVLLDQRGTGNSTPVTSATLKKLPSVEQQANYLAQFR